MSKRTEKIVALERDAERIGRKASALHWEAAALVVLELDAGKTPKTLADQIGKSVRWVRDAARVSRRWNDNALSDRPIWGDAVRGDDAAERLVRDRSSIPRDPAERIEVARKLLADPKVRKAVQAPSDEDRSYDSGDRKAAVSSVADQIRQSLPSKAEAIALELHDLADQISAGSFTAAERKRIQAAADHVATALLEESIL